MYYKWENRGECHSYSLKFPNLPAFEPQNKLKRPVWPWLLLKHASIFAESFRKWCNGNTLTSKAKTFTKMLLSSLVTFFIFIFFCIKLRHNLITVSAVYVFFSQPQNMFLNPIRFRIPTLGTTGLKYSWQWFRNPVAFFFSHLQIYDNSTSASTSEIQLKKWEA